MMTGVIIEPIITSQSILFGGTVIVEIDGKMLEANRIELIDDRIAHNVQVVLGASKVQKMPELVRQAKEV